MRAAGDLDDRAVAHEGGIERVGDVAFAGPAAQPRKSGKRIAACQRRGKRAKSSAPAQARRDRRAPQRARRRRRRCAAAQARRTALPAAPHAPLRPRPAARRAAWRRASGRAGRCISTPRHAGAASRAPRTGGTPPRGGPRPAPSGKSRRSAAKASARPISAAVLMRGDLGRHGVTPPRPGIAHSRWLRARARAPCRRCARCGRSTARARCPARYGRAAAGSG